MANADTNGGALVAGTLRKAGVEVIFSLNGGHIGPIYDGCIDEQIRIVDVRHEEAAGHMAHAYSRVGSHIRTSGTLRAMVQMFFRWWASCKSPESKNRK